MRTRESARRRFLLSLGALAAAPAFSQTASPFGLGVASGYPTAKGVVLWTRVVGASSLTPTPVTWEVASDESMRTIVRRGEAMAEPEWAHSVHVEAQGLEPDRWYWYRFTAGDAPSPIGRTRTAPVAAAQPARLRFGFASCQHYEQGYFNAYRHMVADEPDLMVFLGDYIYEGAGPEGADPAGRRTRNSVSTDRLRLPA